MLSVTTDSSVSMSRKRVVPLATTHLLSIASIAEMLAFLHTIGYKPRLFGVLVLKKIFLIKGHSLLN